MNYYVSRIIKAPFDVAVAQTVDGIKAQGFGVLAEIDIQATLKAKQGVDVRRYRILGA